MTEPYILYGSPSTASLCVHWMLLDLGMPFEHRMLDFSTNDQKREEYLRLNPQGRVPTLMVGGQPVRESTAILMLLAERHPEADLAPKPVAPERAAYFQWMVYLANNLMPAYRNWFYAETDGDPSGAAAIKARARSQIEAVWSHVDAEFADGRMYVLGEKRSAVDYLLTMLARWSRNMPKPATDWPNVKRYIDYMRGDIGLREVHRRENLTDWING